MKLEVLLSCMNQSDISIVKKSRLVSDVLIINQCMHDCEQQLYIDNQRIRMVSTKERGLSKSRNLAIHLSDRDICLLCDDDEVFVSGYQKIILKSFEQLPKADIIAFDISNKKTRLTKKIQKIGKLGSLKLCSVQLAFRRKAILSHGVEFDPIMGAGTGNGACEENKFLFDCIRSGLKVYYVPETIASLNTEGSTWFRDYDELFFRQRGSSTRYMMGLIPSIAYGMYYLLAKYHLYRDTISITDAGRALFGGIYNNTLKKVRY